MESNSPLSLLVSSLGWMLLIAVIGGFLWYGRPYYYQQGLQDQYDYDVAFLDDYYGITGEGSEEAPLQGYLVDIEGDQLIFDVENVFDNPLKPQGEVQTVLLTDQTSFVVAYQKTKAEYDQYIEEHKEEVEQSGLVPLYKEEPGTIEDLVIDGRISILVPPGEDKNAETITALTITYYPDFETIGS